MAEALPKRSLFVVFLTGEGVEKVFPVHSPHVAQIEVQRSGKVRRAKLYYLRELTGKKARIEERRR